MKFSLADIGASFERRCCSVAVNWDVLLNLLVSGKALAKLNYYFWRSREGPRPRNPLLDDKDLSSHIATQSELRASAAEFSFGLRSPAALRVSPGLLLSSFGAVLLLSLSCVALCVLICPDPCLRCCASLLLSRRPSFSLCVEAAVVCVAGGRRHEIRRQDRHPAPFLWLSGDSGLCCFCC